MSSRVVCVVLEVCDATRSLEFVDVSLGSSPCNTTGGREGEGRRAWSRDGGESLESEGQEQSRGWMEEMGHGWKEKPPPFLNSCSTSLLAGSPLLPSARSRET